MAEVATAIDLPCFAYLRMPRDGQAPASLISTYPSPWTDYYLKNHFERLDPVISQAHRSPEPFEWGLGADTFEISSRQKEFFEEASGFGIRCGFTVPIQDGRGPVAAVTFACDQRHPTFQRSIEANTRVLQLMAILLHGHARARLFGHEGTDVKLSARELECLRFAAEGKSCWETGKILDLSPRTVKFHLDNAKRKFGVRTVCQAVARLERLAIAHHELGSTHPSLTN
jgi:DNA-binding CsgD family transcriptional regulator